jgi:hypothetical protein
MPSPVRGAGGTPGGIGTFFAGLAMVLVGGYLLLNRLTVTTGYWTLWGQDAFGLTLLPLLAGVAILFFNGRSALGWLLAVGSAALILVGIIANLRVYLQPTSMFGTLLMLGLLAAGLGTIARALRPYAASETSPRDEERVR